MLRKLSFHLAVILISFLFIVALPAPLLAAEKATVSTADAGEITVLLNSFLANSDKAEAHERFWAGDLVYTSSDGSRTSKNEIMQSFADGEEKESLSTTIYSGEDINVQLFGTTAVVTFRLVGTPDDGSPVLNYFNTGTFLKRNGEWRAVAWQATVIPQG